MSVDSVRDGQPPAALGGTQILEQGALGISSSRVSGAMLGSILSGVCARACYWLPLLLVRGQVVFIGHCVAEVRSCSLSSAWPRSGRVHWL